MTPTPSSTSSARSVIVPCCTKDPRLVEEFQYSATAPSLQRARDITVDAIDDFKAGNLDEIYLIYTKIQNALTSEPVMVRLLPLDRDHLQPAPKGLGDPKGDVEMFPDAWTVFEQTAPIYMHGMIFGAMTESFCAEQSARMTAMDSATKSATEMIHDLQLSTTAPGRAPSPRRSPRSSAARQRYRVQNNLSVIANAMPPPLAGELSSECETEKFHTMITRGKTYDTGNYYPRSGPCGGRAVHRGQAACPAGSAHRVR